MKKYPFLAMLLLALSAGCSPSGRIFSENLKPSTQKYFSQGQTIFVSEGKNTSVQLSAPEIDGKYGKMIVSVTNYFPNPVDFIPESNIMIQVVEGGKNYYVKPYHYTEILQKMKMDQAYMEIASAMSRATVNQYSGYKTVPYNITSSSSTSINGRFYNVGTTQTGVLQYYDQSAVDERNRQDRDVMNQRIAAFNNNLADLDQVLLKSNTIPKGGYSNGYVFFDRINTKAEKIIVYINFGMEYHEFELR